MKILMVLDEEFPPDVRVEKEIIALENAGHTITLVCYTRTDQKLEDKYKNTRVIRIPISKTLYKFKALALLFPFYFSFWKNALSKLIRSESYDIIHFHDLFLAKPVIQTAKSFNIPVIGDFHENKPEIMKMYHHVNSFPGKYLISIKQWQKYQKWALNNLKHIIVVTHEAKEYYSNELNIPENRISVYSNYADLDSLNSYPTDQSIIEKYKNKFMLVYFGDTGIRRGMITVLQAAKELKNRTEFHFVIIGTSREQHILESCVQKHGLSNVELLGYVPVSTAVSYFKAASAGLCPFLRNIHHDTTFSNKMFQYMAFGKAVIVSDCTAQANVVKESDCGMIFPAGDTEQLVNSITELQNRSDYNTLCENAQKAIAKKYNNEITVKELVNLYQSINNEA